MDRRGKRLDFGWRAASRTGRSEDRAPERTYRTHEVIAILGLSRRQLQYWAQTDLVRPSLTTPGGHHRYTFQDLVALRAARRLIDAGVSVQRIRSSIQALRRLLPSVARPLSELVLVATGDVVLVFHEGTAFEAVSGQEWVFPVADLAREIEATAPALASTTMSARRGARPRKVHAPARRSRRPA